MNLPRNTGSVNLSDKERVEREAAAMNKLEGDLKDGFHCEKCNDKGIFFFAVESDTGYRVSSSNCSCMKQRASYRRLRRSGMENAIKRCTFDNYETAETWQARLKAAVKKFADNVEQLDNKWLYIGGGVGAGKTHLCTAVAGELLKREYDLRYMLWVDESTKLKATITDDVKYAEMIEPIKNAEVLYIDDLFKLPPTSADIKLAYEIINHRYQNPNLITIISSEKYVSELEDIDAATGSRIYEKSKGNAYNIKREKNRNYRIRDIELI